MKNKAINGFKRVLSLMFVIAMMVSMFTVTAFAANMTETAWCTGTIPTVPDGTQQMVTDTFKQVDFSMCVGGEYQYGASVRINNGTNTEIVNIFLKQRPEVQDVTVQMTKDGRLDIFGMGKGDSNQWNNLFLKYRTIIVGISGIAAITMIGMFIICFMKLGASAGNPQARQQATTGILFTGIAAVLLGGVSIISGFFYNLL